jgi:6-pyruvoyltetrahydropterin/6-carboxytetrahydropterin synthase
MFRLTREVRFAINVHHQGEGDAGVPPTEITNSYAGFPAITGLAHYFSLRVTLAGDLQGRTNYLLNIKDVDREVRDRVIPLVSQAIERGRFGGDIALELFYELGQSWPGVELDCLELALSPFMSLRVHAREWPMMRLSQKFEFSATHRLFNPNLSDEQNRQVFGKCSNPHGHGHNYEVQVTLMADEVSGVLLALPKFEKVVKTAVIDRFDHKNLNVEVEEFSRLIPTVENIALIIYKLLAREFDRQKAKLASVTVWETPKTWCEYSE